MRLNFVAALAALSSLFISSVKDAAAEPLLSGKAEAEKVFSDRFQLDLINALKNKEFPRVDALIHGGNIDAAATNGETVLWWEANVGDFDAFEYLLKKGANPVCQVLNGLNITEVCAAQTDTRFLLSDLRHGANVNMISSFYRQTPIFAAIMYRNLKNTELLLDSGAYCDVSNDMGETPVVFAGHIQASIRRNI
jgi:ankyrin repeat protein